MSRKPFIAGNWKMNKNPEEAKAFVEAVASKLPSADLVEAGIAAPAVDLTTVLAAAKGSNLKVAAQNTYFENAGAFTGETSPQVLKEIGTDYVVIGHQNVVTTSTKLMKISTKKQKQSLRTVCFQSSVVVKSLKLTKLVKQQNS